MLLSESATRVYLHNNSMSEKRGKFTKTKLHAYGIFNKIIAHQHLKRHIFLNIKSAMVEFVR
jgi:hypothetical protein